MQQQAELLRRLLLTGNASTPGTSPRSRIWDAVNSARPNHSSNIKSGIF
jgi:hypothetical protein